MSYSFFVLSPPLFWIGRHRRSPLSVGIQYIASNDFLLRYGYISDFSYLHPPDHPAPSRDTPLATLSSSHSRSTDNALDPSPHLQSLWQPKVSIPFPTSLPPSLPSHPSMPSFSGFLRPSRPSRRLPFLSPPHPPSLPSPAPPPLLVTATRSSSAQETDLVSRPRCFHYPALLLPRANGHFLWFCVDAAGWASSSCLWC